MLVFDFIGYFWMVRKGKVKLWRETALNRMD